MRRDTIRDQLERIRRLVGEADTRTGQLRRSRDRASARKIKQVTLFALFVSDENTWLLRPHIFRAEHGRTPSEWREWFREHYTTRPQEDGKPGILTQILDGISRKSGGEKHWRIYRVIGWAADDRSEVINPKAAKKRNKTKQKRRKNGHVHTRR